MFSKILIANRGEIAVRIIRACKEMGISTVAVFSEADREALHVSLADESYCIGPAPVGESYLNMAAIISAAICSGAQAIHPGYGLLSENARFAALCEECNITFIGPRSETIAKTGDKDEARKTMRAAGVPVIPGCDAVSSVEEAKEQAKQIGFPLLIKARAGGGGRGIRLVKEESELEAAYLNASREALSAFGDGGVYMEKYLYPAKHIEMQILCDKLWQRGLPGRARMLDPAQEPEADRGVSLQRAGRSDPPADDRGGGQGCQGGQLPQRGHRRVFV